MWICMTTQMRGTRNGLPWPDVGDVVDLPTAEAAHLVAAGVAKPADPPPTARPSRARKPKMRGR